MAETEPSSPTSPADDPRLRSWQRRSDWPLTGLAGLFLALYAIQVLYVSAPPTTRTRLETAVWVIWALFAADYLIRFSLARHKLTTITTVGYGDRYPITAEGKLVAAALMVGGIALLGVVTGLVASWFVRVLKGAERTEDALHQELVALRQEIRALATSRPPTHTTSPANEPGGEGVTHPAKPDTRSHTPPPQA